MIFNKFYSHRYSRIKKFHQYFKTCQHCLKQ
nr:MAG TPA: protein of unknown function DUF1660 [Caudoviricetes sp.]